MGQMIGGLCAQRTGLGQLGFDVGSGFGQSINERLSASLCGVRLSMASQVTFRGNVTSQKIMTLTISIALFVMYEVKFSTSRMTELMASVAVDLS